LFAVLLLATVPASPGLSGAEPLAGPTEDAALVRAPGPAKGSPAQRAAGAAAPGVLVVAIDALRADHLSCMGYDRPTTPSIDALAAEGVRFSQAFASSPLIIPSNVALLTGCEPLVARRNLPEGLEALLERRWAVPESVPRLSVELLYGGFRTAAFVSDERLSPIYGFDPGFQRYVVLEEDERALGPTAEQAAGQFLQWLRSVDRSQPWFAYLHLADLEHAWSQPDLQWESFFQPRGELAQVPPVGHTGSVFFAVPYTRWRGGTRSLGDYEVIYDGHLRRLDEALGRLFGALRNERRFENTIVCVVGTFGLQFGEAGLYLTAGRYSVADLHVPWILRLPPGMGAEPGRVVETLASGLDVAPTLLELCGLEVPAGTHGISQAAAVLSTQDEPAPAPRDHVFASCGLQEGGAVIGRRYCLEYLQEDVVENAAWRRAWFGENQVGTGRMTTRFYDRLEDPHPPLDREMVPPLPPEHQVLRQAALGWVEDMALTSRHLQPIAGQAPLSEEELGRLLGKGLVGGERR